MIGMPKGCTHIAGIRNVTPSALGCEECLKSGSVWLHLRICRTCGHVGCCDDSPNKHATKHFHATQHPVIEGYDPPEGWGWCYVDEVLLPAAHLAWRSNHSNLPFSSAKSSASADSSRGGLGRLAPSRHFGNRLSKSLVTALSMCTGG